MQQVLERYIEENDLHPEKYGAICFREGKHYSVHCEKKRIVPKRVIDRYMLSFLWRISYTENCYYCKYARKERCADITLGDAWGQLSETEQMVSF